MNTGNPLPQSDYKWQKRKFTMDDKRLGFVSGKQREFLETVIRKEFKSINDFVQFLGFSRRAVLSWRREDILLPSKVFEKICASFAQYRKFEKFILEKLPANWGGAKGRVAYALRMKRVHAAIRNSMKEGDTKLLRELLESLKKPRRKMASLFIPKLIESNKPPLYTSKVKFSRKDIIKGITLPKELSIDLCYLIGAHIGDGFMNSYHGSKGIDNQYRCCGHPINDRSWYDTVLIPLMKRVFNLQLKGKHSSDGSYSIGFRSKAILGFYHKSIGLPLGKKSAKIDIPDIILGAGLQYTLACISGVFDTDFYLGFKNKNNTVHTYPFIELKVKSEPLVKSISTILNKIGLSNSIARSKKFDKRFHKVIESHIVKSSGQDNVVRWFELIGSRNPNYLSKYIIWKKFGFCPPNLDYNQRKEILEGRKNPLQFYNVVNGDGENRTHDLPVSAGSNISRMP